MRGTHESGVPLSALKWLPGQDFLRQGSLSPFGWLRASSRSEGGQAHGGSRLSRKAKIEKGAQQDSLRLRSG